MSVVLLNKTSAVVKLDTPFSLTAQVYPPAPSTGWIWASSNLDVASVAVTNFGPTGALLTQSTGRTEVTAKFDDETISPPTKILVVSPVTGVTLSSSTLTVEPGAEPQSLVATVLPATANQIVFWHSSNPGCATVSNEGQLSFVGSGTSTITVLTQDGAKTATCVVTVTSSYTPPVAIKSVTITPIDSADLPLIVGQEPIQLAATVLPVKNTETASQDVFWSYASTANATVSADGLLTINAAGPATITATSKADVTKKATLTLNITTPQTGFFLSESDNLTLVVGATKTVKSTPIPLDVAPPATASWLSNNLNVATVSNAGVVTGVAVGQATVTASAVLGGEQTTKTLTVNVLAKGAFEIDLPDVSPQGYASIVAGVKTVKISRDFPFNIPTILTVPPQAVSTYSIIDWVATPNNVLSLTPVGGASPSCSVSVLPGVTGAKSVVLKATTRVGGFTDSITLVLPLAVPVTYVNIMEIIENGAAISVEVTTGKLYYIPALVSPPNATDNTLVWTVDTPGGINYVPNYGPNPGCAFTVVPNTSVATVTITATSASNNTKSSSITIYIAQP